MLTKRQKQVLDYIKKFISRHDYAPSLEEIKRHLKLNSVSTAHFHVSTLQNMGHLRKEDNQPRALDVFSETPLVQIPLLGTIAAGQPIEAIEDKEYIAFPQDKIKTTKDHYALRVTGESMIDENINDGDIVVVRNQQTANNGNKVVALINNSEVTLKKIYKEKNQVRLEPANPKFDPILVSYKNIRIQGIVVDVIKNQETNDRSFAHEFISAQYRNRSSSKRSKGKLNSNFVEKSPILVNRTKDFDDIKKRMSSYIKVSISKGILMGGDSLEILKSFPSHSVSLILTDPPYHSTKKRNIYGDTSFKEDQHYIEWLSLYAKEWKRVLKSNGSLFCFCAPVMAARLESLFSTDFNILSHITWTKPNAPGFDGWKQKMKKESLRQWYNHSERIIFAEPAHPGNLHRSSFGNLLKECRQQAGLAMNQLTAIIGAYGKVNHGGAVSNWEAGRNVPSKEQYEKIREAILQTKRVKSMPKYEDAVRPFMIDASKEFTDIWNFPNIRPYQGKHPAEKPVALLEHAIRASSFPGDIVLDCFAGSGTTAIAALKSGRYTISIEIEKSWLTKIGEHLKYIEKNNYKKFPDNYKAKDTILDRNQETLFD